MSFASRLLPSFFRPSFAAVRRGVKKFSFFFFHDPTRCLTAQSSPPPHFIPGRFVLWPSLFSALSAEWKGWRIKWHELSLWNSEWKMFYRDELFCSISGVKNGLKKFVSEKRDGWIGIFRWILVSIAWMSVVGIEPMKHRLLLQRSSARTLRVHVEYIIVYF